MLAHERAIEKELSGKRDLLVLVRGMTRHLVRSCLSRGGNLCREEPFNSASLGHMPSSVSGPIEV